MASRLGRDPDYAVAVLAVAAAVVAGLLADRLLQTAPFVSLFFAPSFSPRGLAAQGLVCSQPDSPLWLLITTSFPRRILSPFRPYRASPFLR